MSALCPHPAMAGRPRESIRTAERSPPNMAEKRLVCRDFSPQRLAGPQASPQIGAYPPADFLRYSAQRSRSGLRDSILTHLPHVDARLLGLPQLPRLRLWRRRRRGRLFSYFKYASKPSMARLSRSSRIDIGKLRQGRQLFVRHSIQLSQQLRHRLGLNQPAESAVSRSAPALLAVADAQVAAERERLRSEQHDRR